MTGPLTSFGKLLYGHLIPEFCSDPARRCDFSTFKRASVCVSESDAADFLRAWEAQLIRHVGRGQYRTARSAASEQFFWEGRNLPGPRTFSLWIEPIVTVAALARLHFEYGWPEHLIATQSVDWAFDIVTFASRSENEHIAGEVKKTRTEIDTLLELMRAFGKDPDAHCPPNAKGRNAFKKMSALRARRAPIFWAIGPDGYHKVHLVNHLDSGCVELIESEEDILLYGNCLG